MSRILTKILQPFANRALRNELGCVLHKAAVAQIGHEQLNRFIKLALEAGAPKGLPIDQQIEWMVRVIKQRAG